MALNNHFIKILAATIREILKFDTHPDKFINEFLKSNPKLSGNERKIAIDTIYGVLRNYFKITQIVSKGSIFDIIGITFLKILHLEPEAYAKIDSIDFLPLQKLDFKQDDLSNYELPQFILDKFSTQYPTDYESLIESLNKRANIDLRINILKAKLPQVTAILEKDNIPYISGQYSPYAIRLKDQGISPKHQLVTSGSIEFQDESSQLASQLLNPKRGSLVVDFCAGSGGKALFFGMIMHGSGRIYVFDTNMRRLNNLEPRLEKSGLKNIYPELIAHENDPKIKRFWGKIDHVFVDAPCSGLGTLRRNPELKFTLNAAKLEALTQTQYSILTAASKLVKPGGNLVYATCSILHEENQDIINKFLTENSDFSIINANTVIKNCDNLISKEGFLIILPQQTDGDGFFAAKLVKK